MCDNCTKLEKQVKALQTEVAKLQKVCDTYSAVHNALPLPFHLTILEGFYAVFGGGKPSVGYDDFAAMEVYLTTPYITIHPAPSTHMSEMAYGMLVPCAVCGKALDWNESYLHVKPKPTAVMEGFMCHKDCYGK